jgi:predicted Rossmann-fold nucleotide-binding protein
MMKYAEIETQKEIKHLFHKPGDIIDKVAFKNVDLSEFETEALKFYFSNCLFLGCAMTDKIKQHIEKENYLFPELNVPYNIYPSRLYDRDDLYGDYEPGNPDSYEKTFDKIVYKHFVETGKEARSINETLARRLHDHSITDALYNFLGKYDEKKVVAVMGGHSLKRNTEDYKNIVKLSKELTEDGYLMISGGGPGAMEATHVGAWFAGKTVNELEKAFQLLDKAPVYKDPLWLDTAMQVIQKYPNDKNYESLGIPTWLYGHEPPTPFASKIAKYFANSVREDGLLTVAKGGIIYSPGSAGTIQEVFQEITQNHYLSFGYASPMIFLNKQFWTEEAPVYSYISDLVQKKKLKNLILSVHDTRDGIKNELKKFYT